MKSPDDVAWSLSQDRLRFFQVLEKVRSLITRSIMLYKTNGIKLILCFIMRKIAITNMKMLNNIVLPKPKEEYIIKKILGSNMYLDVADPGVCRALIIDGVRETASIESYLRELKAGDIAVDIGANIGYYALLGSRLVGESGKVYAIEPAPANIELLRKNIGINGISNINVYELAISDENGSLPLRLNKQRNSHALGNYDRGTLFESMVVDTIDVQTMTLDDFLNDKLYPDIVRMDVEGYEYQIIRGMENTLRQKRPLALFIEFHFGIMKRQKSREILETFKNTGFRVAAAAIEYRKLGLHRHRISSWLYRSTQAAIEEGLDMLPSGKFLDLTIDDILSDPDILDGKYNPINFCFKRD